jgi:two-component system phosphate regulon response regulator OmpR
MPQSEAPSVIIVEDDVDIRVMIADYLSRDGYEVGHCGSGEELKRELSSRHADLILLDIQLPGEDGISIARRLRAHANTPIIMLTGRDDIVDRVVGLEIGADDYMTKPFDLRELRARVRAVIRRTCAEKQKAGPRSAGNVVCFGKVCLDLDRRALFDEDGAEIKLTATEFDLLSAFARAPNRVLSREFLLDTAPARDRESFDRAIDIRITRIRQKVEVEPAKPQVIRTVRNAGYMFVPPRAHA